MTQANQMTPMPTVSRSRFFSATEEPPSELETPPPNMSERPPPRPLCSRTSMITSRLVSDQNDREEEIHGGILRHAVITRKGVHSTGMS